jgi:hypothetical protein
VSDRVSVVIPHFNRSALAREAIESAIHSDHDNVEVIVVDDGSSPDEWEKIQALRSERVRVLKRDSGEKGPSRCRNEGVRASTGDFIVFLDSDDLLAPWCIADRISAATKYPQADCWVFPVMLFKQSPGDLDLLWNSLDSTADDGLRFARSDPPWHTSSPLWRKSSFTSLGGFNESLVYGDDSDLHMRAIIVGKQIRKFTDAMPGAFVRRSHTPRITNTVDSRLLASRLKRLTAGTRFLQGRTKTYRDAWEGQYFMEGEFLLFNLEKPDTALTDLFAVWEQDYPAARTRRIAARAYFSVAMRSRDRAYLIVRLARRLAMLLFPPEYFPSTGEFENATIGADSMRLIRERIANPSSTSPQ